MDHQCGYERVVGDKNFVKAARLNSECPPTTPPGHLLTSSYDSLLS